MESEKLFDLVLDQRTGSENKNAKKMTYFDTTSGRNYKKFALSHNETNAL